MLRHKKWSRKMKKKFLLQIAKAALINQISYLSDELDLFHIAVGPVFKVAQYFSLMPLQNIMSSDPYRVEFKYASVAVLRTGCFLFFGGIQLVLILTDYISAGITTSNIVGIFFFSCGLSACVLFACLAGNWPELIKYWTKVEVVFLQPPYKQSNFSLKYKIRIAAAIVGVLYAVEHGLFFASDVFNYRMSKSMCHSEVPPSYRDYLTNHFMGYIFDHIYYHILISVPILILNSVFTFIWNYMDLFIILVSLGLAQRFQQIGERALELSEKSVPQCTWREVRLHYVQLCELVDVVDGKISWIILLSSVNNLYFICYQILNIFNKLHWPINYVYFWYSFLYLLGRTAFVFLCASKIHDESKVPLLALRSVPSAGWGDEVERFSIQISSECVALSGRKLFFITRKLLFGMAATIVTYELVLLQLDDLTMGHNLGPLCG
ncbi:gustatory receptor for sugar taste 64a-like [Eupeodes corollae]|uniref:gustatory receptor for sugar taste 64a-like n=1 Tax=Eupeodes corollae TaxID=290404 RepID=UPI002492B99E|nr:gustatory receptor for sugar taste 64a-like [Eupeodes corollae]